MTPRAIFRIAAASIFFFLAISVCPAQTHDNNPAAWVERASVATNIRSDGGPPFELRGRVAIMGPSNSPIDGTYRLTWISGSQWREEVHLPGYDRVRVGASGAYWQRRSLSYEVLRVWQLDKLLTNLYHVEMQPNDRFGRGRERKIGQEKQNCVDVIDKHGFHRIESCFDQTSGLLLGVSDLSSHGQSFDGLTRMEYSDYESWGGKAFPRSMHALIGKIRVIEFHVDELKEAQATTATTFEILPGDAKWISCEKPEDVSILEQSRPQYPPEARAEGKQGTVAIYVVVESTGEISHEKVIAAAYPALVPAAFEAVSHWKYKPPACDGVPYSLENVIFVTFTIGR